MMKCSLTAVRACALAGALAAPALALENPVVVDVHSVNGAQRAASATIFGSGSRVLVNVTANAAVPKGAAVSLNDGDCAKPGDIAFALSGFADNASLTQLNHSLSDVAEKAKSLVIHENSKLNSPAFACGSVSG